MKAAQTSARRTFPYIILWLILRVLTSLGAAVFSKIRPISALERAVVLWPPASDLALWLNRAFLEPWLRWDAVWYVNVLVAGYAAGNGSTSFHPLYVILSWPLYQAGVLPLLSLMLTSTLAALGFFWVFYRLARLDLPPEQSRLALILLGSFPAAFILFAPYPSSLFLLFATIALYEMRLRHWLLAAAATCLASLTRQQGVLLAIPMLWYAWQDSAGSFRGAIKAWRGWLATLTAPAGLIIWAIYRLGFLHEGSVDLRSWHAFIYSVVLSSSAGSVVPNQEIMWPWQSFGLAMIRLTHGPSIEDVMSFTLGLAFVGLLVLAWRTMRPADRAYSAANTLISFSYYTGAASIYLGLPRHLLLAVPVFIGLAPALKRRWQRILLISIQLTVQVFMLFLYVTKSWIP